MAFADHSLGKIGFNFFVIKPESGIAGDQNLIKFGTHLLYLKVGFLANRFKCRSERLL